MTQEDASISSETQGYLLLTLSNVQVHRLYQSQSIPIAFGDLRLECISLPIDPSIGHQRANPFADDSSPTMDLWLVLQVGTYETTLLPTQKMIAGLNNEGGRTLTVLPEDGGDNGIVLTLAKPQTSDDEDDVSTLEVLLRQYGCLPSEQVPEVTDQAAVPSKSSDNLSSLPSSSLAPPIPARPGLHTSSSQGRLVLVDSTSGEVVGELDQTLSVEEDAAISENGREKEPVIVDFGDIEYSGVVKHVEVRTVPEEDMDDWMLKGAHYLSKGILSISGASQSAINSAAEFYIAHSTPTSEPAHFSPAAKTGIRQVHNVTAKGYKVTKKTLGMVNEAIVKYVGPVADKGFQAGYEFSEAVKADFTSGDQKEDPQPTEPTAKPKKPFFSRLILAGEVVLTSLEAAGQGLINTSTDAASNAAGHKYGPEAAQATQLLGGSVRNVALVYVDVRGIGRQALLQSTAKGFVKTTLKSGNKVRLQAHAKNGNAQITMADGEVVQPTVTVEVETPGLTVTPPAADGPVNGAALTEQGYPLEKQELFPNVDKRT